MTLERFVETRSAYEWGLVCHAFAGAIREILEDWRLFVTQLEHQHMTSTFNLQVFLTSFYSFTASGCYKIFSTCVITDMISLS